MVPVSHARYRDSLVGELEFDLAAAEATNRAAEREAEQVRSKLAQAAAERDALHGEIAAIKATKT